MKRIFSILLITVLLVGLMPVIPNVAMAASYATITSENGLGVNLREGPGTGYKKIDAYPVGTTVEVLQQGTEWSQIQLGGSVTGWMMSRFLAFGASGSGSSSGSSTGSSNAYVVSDNGLRVWLRASAGGTRLFLNAAGTPVEVISYDDTWCYIRIGATYGYMKTKYLSVGQQGSGTGTGSTTPTVTTGRVTEVEINYSHPVVLDTLEAIVTSPDAQVDYEWYVRFPVGNAYYPAGATVMLGTEATFDVLTRYADCEIQVKVTGKDGSTGTATSAWTAPVQISKGLKSVEIDKDGAPVVGETLSALLVPSSALGDYSWRVGGVEVSTESTYTVQEGDIGKLIQLRVTGIGGYVGTVACSADAAVVSDKTLQSAELNILNPVVGDKLSATVLPEGATYTYAWLANGELVGTAATYKVDKMDLGKQITVNVTGTGDYTGTVSDTTGKVSSGKLTGVTITGSPMIGETVYAKLTPESATATYEWYIGDSDVPEFTGIVSSMDITPDAWGIPVEEWLGKKIKVRAYPSGVYTVDGEEGFVEYTLSEAIFEDHPIHSIAILNTTPVYGDEIHVELKPEKANDLQSQFSYVWFVDTETSSQHGNVYTVQDSDIGKKIRVQVIGTNTTDGDYTDKTAYSSWTSAVKGSNKLSGITVENVSTGENALTKNPIVGDELKACVVPASADPFVTYTWSDADGNVLAFDTSTYIVDAADEGKRITVYAEVTTPSIDPATGVENYTGDKKVATAKVKAADPLDADFYIRKPEAGITPTFSASAKDTDNKVIATAKIEWMQQVGAALEKASFDKFGHFEPGVTYVAKLTVTPKVNKSLYQATVAVNGDYSTYKDADAAFNTNVYYYDFGVTPTNTITDYYIADLEVPTLSAGIWNLDEVCGNTQVEAAAVNWTYDAATSTYVAEIELSVRAGLDLDFSNIPVNAFKVNGAFKTENAANSNIVSAYFDIDHDLYIDTDKSEVYLDGYNRVIVQCSAYMTNYNDELPPVTWEIVSAKVDGTTINANGQLVIGMYETADRTLTIRATVEIAGEEFSVTKDIPLISGTSTDTAINVVFKKYATKIEQGDDATFSAIVSNSTEGCTIVAIDKTGSTVLGEDSGVLSTGAYDVGDLIVVKAISDEDHSVVATLLVEITDPALGLGTNQVYNLEDEEEELAVEMPEEETEIVEEVIEEPVVEAIEEVVELPMVEVTEEVIEEPVVEIIEEVVEEPVVEIIEEVVEEPVVEIIEEVVEEPVVEIIEEVVEEPVVEIVEEVVEEPVVEIAEEVVEEPVVEIAEEVVEEPVVEVTEEVVEEPVVETVEEAVEETVEEEVEVLDDVVISIVDTVTGEVVEENLPVNSEKPASEQKDEPKTEKPETVTEELVEEEPDEELDALEGADIGQSVENEAQIVISFTKTVSEAKRGATAEFAAEVEGSDAGVQWMLRRSKNADGKVVSSISQDGVLTVSADETADKLVVIAASAEDSTIRARWIVDVVKKSASSSTSSAAEEEVVEPVVEETAPVEQPEAVTEEQVEEPEVEEEIVAEDEGLSEEMLQRIEEELRMLEEQQSVLNFF